MSDDVVRRRRIVGPGGIVRWNRDRPRVAPTYAPSAELLAEVDAYLADQRIRDRKPSLPTHDRYLAESDASLTGWRERVDEHLHHYYPKETAA